MTTMSSITFMFQNTFYLESAIDESAHLAGKNPFDYRIELLRNNPRFVKVLELVAPRATSQYKLSCHHFIQTKPRRVRIPTTLLLYRYQVGNPYVLEYEYS